MQAVILAGGLPKRLNSTYAHVPKPLMPLFERPILEHTIKLMAKNGLRDIIMALSAEALDIAKYFGDGSQFGVKIRYSVEHKPLGTAGCLRLIRDMLEGTFVVVSGDIITDIDLKSSLNKHKENNALMSVLLTSSENPSEYGIAFCNENGRMIKFLEKPEISDLVSDSVNTGIYIMEPEVISSIPDDEVHDISVHLIPRLLSNQELVFGLRANGYWCDSGDPSSYRKAHADVITGLLKIDIGSAKMKSNIYFGSDLHIDPTAEISSPVYIGDRSEICAGARIGKNTVLGNDVIVEQGAVVVNSMIGSGCVVHKNARINGCVISGGYELLEDIDYTAKIIIEHTTYAVEQPQIKVPKIKKTVQVKVEKMEPEKVVVLEKNITRDLVAS